MTLLLHVASAVALLYVIRKIRERSWGKCRNAIKLDGQVAIVTGANSGIGYEVAKELCGRGAEVIFACRDEVAATKAIKSIEKSTMLETKKTYIHLDLTSLNSVQKFVSEVRSRYTKIHILINNAGISSKSNLGLRTIDGFEVNFGVNHLGHFFLTNLLIDLLEEGSPSRVIVVSSKLSKNVSIDFSNLNAEIPTKTENLYAMSKLANAHFAWELHDRLQGKSIDVYIVSPGWVWTRLFRNDWLRFVVGFMFIAPVAFIFMRTAKQGSETIVYCATEPSLQQNSSIFYRDCKATTEFDSIRNPKIARKLWYFSQQIIADVVKDVIYKI